MRKTIYLVVLLVSLSSLAYAGEMPQPQSSGTSVQGDMHYPLTEMIVTALQTAVSLI